MQLIDLLAELTWSININMYNNITHPDWVYQQSSMGHDNYKYNEYKLLGHHKHRVDRCSGIYRNGVDGQEVTLPKSQYQKAT